MKKLKSILCITFAFILTAIVLCACGINNNKGNQVGTKTTISLAEAKRIIVNALAIDNNQLQTQSTRGMVLHAADVSEGNRDIFEKLGEFTWTETMINTVIESNEKDGLFCNGIIKYNKGVTEALITEGNIPENTRRDNYIFDNIVHTIEYEFRNNEKLNIESIPDAQYLENRRFAAVKDYFTDDAFAILYEDDVIKETTKTNYSLTFNTTLKDAYLWTSHKSSLESEKEAAWLRYKNYIEANCSELIDACHFNVIVNFNENNEIVSIISDVVILQDLSEYSDASTELAEYKIVITKTSQPITKPDWINA